MKRPGSQTSLPGLEGIEEVRSWMQRTLPLHLLMAASRFGCAGFIRWVHDTASHDTLAPHGLSAEDVWKATHAGPGQPDPETWARLRAAMARR